jgi:hypothetical protein
VKAIFGTGKKRVAGCAVLEGKLAKAGYVTVKRGAGKVGVQQEVATAPGQAGNPAMMCQPVIHVPP